MQIKDFINVNSTTLGFSSLALIIMLIWSLIWKGLALWRAARRKESAWFVVLLIVNTVGILEIFYYFFITKSDEKNEIKG